MLVQPSDYEADDDGPRLRLDDGLGRGECLERLNNVAEGNILHNGCQRKFAGLQEAFS